MDSTTQDSYQGWSNRQTWAVMLSVNNEQAYQEDALELVRSTPDDYDAEQALRDYVESYMVGDALEGASLAVDLLGHALAVVDWRECVAALREDAAVTA